MLNLASLNQRVNALTGKINNIVPGGTQDLATTLGFGNSAGANGINMNSNDILSVNNINVTTINGSAYPPVVASDTIQQVLTAGNTATSLSMILSNGAGVPTTNTLSSTQIEIDENFATTTPSTATLTAGNLEIKVVNGPAGTTTTTDINPANIVLADTGQPTTTFSTTSLTSGASSATWADIISGTASDNTLQEVLIAGNTASNLNITLTGPSGSQMTLSPVSNNLGAIETFTPVVPFNTAQSLIGIGASSGNLTSTMDIFDTSTPITYQISGQIVQAGDRINNPYNVKPEVQLFTQYTDTMGVQTNTANYQVSGITHQSTTPYEINTNANIGITASNVILTSSNLTSTADTLTLKSPSSGYTSSPNAIIENTAFNAGNTTGVPSVEYYKSGRITVLNDVVMSQQFNARAYNNVKTTFGKIECSITGNSAPTGIDGALDFYTCINGVNQNVMRLNGADNENNTFRPFDLNGNALKTSQGNMTIDTTSSTGTGTITISPKAGTFVNIPSAVDASNDYIRINPQVSPNAQQILMTANNGAGQANSINLLNAQFNPFIELKADFGGAINKSVSLNVNGNGSNPNSISSYDGQTDLPFQIISTGIANGSIEFIPQSATGDLIFTGTNIQSGSSGGNSGQHLRIKLNGTYYKIALQDD